MADYQMRLDREWQEARAYTEAFSRRCDESAEASLSENALYCKPAPKQILCLLLEAAVAVALLLFRDKVFWLITQKMRLGMQREFFHPVLWAACVMLLCHAVAVLAKFLISVHESKKVKDIHQMAKTAGESLKDHAALSGEILDAISRGEDMEITPEYRWESSLRAFQNRSAESYGGAARIRKIALSVYWLALTALASVFFSGIVANNLAGTENFTRGNTVMLSYVLLVFLYIKVMEHLAPYYPKLVKPVLSIAFAAFQTSVILRLFRADFHLPMVRAYHTYLADAAIPEKLSIPYAISRGFVLDYHFLVLFLSTLLILLLLTQTDATMFSIRLKEGVALPMTRGKGDIIRTGAQLRRSMAINSAFFVVLAQYGGRFAADAFLGSSNEAVTTVGALTLVGITVVLRIMASSVSGDDDKAIFAKTPPILKYAFVSLYALLALSARPVYAIWPYGVLALQYLLML